MLDGQAVAVLGGGGHAKVVISTLRSAGYDVWGVLDDDPEKLGESLLGVEVVGRIDALRGRPAVIGVGSNAARRAIAARLPGQAWVCAVHSTAEVDTSVRLGPGTIVFAGVVVQPDTVIGAHVIVNTGATVDHDCVLGDFVHIAPGCHVAGGVQIGEGAFLGIGSAVIPGIRIGAWATVGAGAVVVEDVPDGVTVVGVPARPLEKKG